MMSLTVVVLESLSQLKFKIYQELSGKINSGSHISFISLEIQFKLFHISLKINL
jgi:hypothetical protein